MFFEKLSDSILMTLLCDWLSAKDIVTLDTAFCSTVQRPVWLKSLTRIRGNKCIDGFEHRHKSMRWLIMRQVMVTCIRLHQCCDEEEDEDDFDEDGYDIRDDSFSGIDMPSLESVNCYDMTKETDRFEYSFNDASLDTLSLGCPNIKRIFLGHIDGVSEEGMVRFATRCSKLESVKMSFVRACNFSSVLCALSSCPIKELIVVQCPALTDEIVQRMTELFPRLEKLHISGCRNITDASLVSLSVSSMRIKELHIFDSTTLSADSLRLLLLSQRLTLLTLVCDSSLLDVEGMRVVKDSCQHLERLRLIGFYPTSVPSRVTSESWLGSFKRVHTLGLSATNLPTDACLTELSLTCWDLEFLSILRCRNVTSVGICAIISRNPRLEAFEWDGSSAASVVDELSRSCKKLRLGAFVGSDLTDAKVEQLVTACPLLERLELPGCSSLTPACLASMSKLAHLEYLDISECAITSDDVKTHLGADLSFECLCNQQGFHMF